MSLRSDSLLSDLEKATTHLKKQPGSTSGWKMTTPADFTTPSVPKLIKNYEYYGSDEVFDKFLHFFRKII